MGFSVSAATAIIFAGLILLMGVVADTVFDTYGDLKDAALDTSDSEYDRQRTRVNIVNASFNSTTVFVNATNTGEIVLDTQYVDLLVNGTIETEKIVTREVEGTTSQVWGIHEVLFVEITYSGANNDSRIRLITENGVSGTKKIN
jgi:flagellar protein FlaF